MEYFESDEMFTNIISRYFTNKAPKYIKVAKKQKKRRQKKEKVEEPKIVYPTDLLEAIKFKQDYKKSFPNNYDPEAVEKFWYDWWIKRDFYHVTAKEALTVPHEKRYVMILPPPNVTGRLHIGHGLTGAIQDTLIRWKRMQGFKCVWVPGVDHAGISTQSVVEKTLAKQNISKYDLGREDFVKKVWEWKEEYGNTITTQLRRIGSSLDWQRYTFTMDDTRSVAVKETFYKLYKKGLIYRGNRLINWCCTLGTAISNIEVDHINIAAFQKMKVPGYDKMIEFGCLVEFAYKVEGTDEEIVVATTRIETMLGDVAVAVNSQDERYKHLIGKNLVHPIIKDRKMTVIVDDELVDMAFGTGAVKVTPAHDPNDFECGKRNNLEFINILNDNGTFNENTGKYQNKRRYDVRYELIAELTELGLFRGKKPNPMSITVCSKSKDVIEPLMRPQWYVDCKDIAKRMINVVKTGEMNIYPPNQDKIWFHFLENIEDWCISRQLWWGHQIPAYKAILKDGTPLKDDKGETAWFIGRNEEEISVEVKAKTNEEFTLLQDEDVLDTWFSSALLPFSSFDWPNVESDEFKAFFPNHVLETGNDILFFWVARMVMMSLLLTDKVPFKEVILHSMVRDENNEKMSKTKGNVIDPLEVIDGCDLDTIVKKIQNSVLKESEKKKSIAYKKKKFKDGIPRCGSDALRYSLLGYFNETKDINLDLSIVIRDRQFCNKIWNSYKLIRMLIPDDFKFEKTQAKDFLNHEAVDLWILYSLNQTIAAVNKSFTENKFGDAVEAISSFWTKKFCDFYLEYSKKVDENNKEKLNQNRQTLFYILETFLRLLHPVMPFLSEELYQKLPQFENKNETVSLALYPTTIPEFENEEYLQFEKLISIIKDIRKKMGMVNIPSKSTPPLYFSFSEENKKLETLLLNNAGYINSMTRTSDMKVVQSKDVPKETLCGTSFLTLNFAIYLKGILEVKEELLKISKSIHKAEQTVAKLEKKINGKGYKDKVPQKVQDRELLTLTKNKTTLEDLRENEIFFKRLM